MSSKRRNIGVMDEDGSCSSSSESEGDPQLQQFVDQSVMVDFEGRTPTETDYHGIRQLLMPLLPRAHVNWGDLTDIIISQSYVGSVLKQCEEEGPDADDDEDAMDAESEKEVYGITTAVNLTARQDRESVKDLTRTLLGRCKSSGAPRQVQERMQAVLSSSSEHCALLINERFVNIPLQICVPLLTSLRDEIEESAKKSMPYNFSYFLLISKLHRAEKPADGKKTTESSGKELQDGEITWLNGEDELFNKAAECSFEFSVAAETDTAVDGSWTDRDVRQTPLRRVLLLPAAALPAAIEQISQAVRALPS